MTTMVCCTIDNCNYNDNGVCSLSFLHIIREKWDEVPVETCVDADYNLKFKKE